MPIYEYVCDACGNHAEIMQKMGEVATECPVCHKHALKKRVSAPGFQLKGSGWYATDFKGAAASAPAAKPEPQASAAATAPCGASCACH